MTWITPKTDWNTNPKVPGPDDLNRIEGNILEIYNDVLTGKQNLYNAIFSKGVTPDSQAFADLVTAIGEIIRATGDAQQEHVLDGKEFSNLGANNLTGTMPNRSGDTPALSITRNGTTLKLLASKGFRDGVDDYVTYTDANFIAANIKKNVTLFGLEGAYEFPTLTYAAGQNPKLRIETGVSSENMGNYSSDTLLGTITISRISGIVGVEYIFIKDTGWFGSRTYTGYFSMYKNGSKIPNSDASIALPTDLDYIPPRISIPNCAFSVQPGDVIALYGRINPTAGSGYDFKGGFRLVTTNDMI